MPLGGRCRAIALASALLASACTVGGGNGQVVGEIFVLRCGEEAEDFGAVGDPAPFDLKPTFFAGEPLEDIVPSGGTNRLLIRLSRTGNRPEINDNFYVDVQDTHDVASCLRGQSVNGLPAFDASWCVRTAALGDGGVADAGADGGAAPTADDPIIQLDAYSTVRASLVPANTCNAANLTGVAVAGSWIRFEHFGDAKTPSIAPEAREPVPDDFKIEFGDRVRATFHVELADLRVIEARRVGLPEPPQQIGGYLDGYFDFDLERGRAAQPFP